MHTFLAIAGILAIAATLRVPFTGAAPLLTMVSETFSLGNTEMGILTTLPLLAFAIISPLAAKIANRLSVERSLLLAMLLICSGIALRSITSLWLLYTGTLIIGAGIALGNVLLPAIIKRRFPTQIAKITGAYSVTMGIAAAIGSAMVVPLAMMGLGWSGALFTLIIFPALAAILWLPQLKGVQGDSLSSSRVLHNRGIWRNALAWQVTLFLGLNSLIYYIMISWLPAILISHGYSETYAGSLHGLLQLATAVPGLFIPLLMSRMRDQSAIAVGVSLMCILGTFGLYFMPSQAALWTFVFGFGSGSTIILGLSFIGLRSTSSHQAIALSGMAQSIGYLLAAAGPTVMGKLHDISGSWGSVLMVIASLSLIMAINGALAGRDRQLSIEQTSKQRVCQ